MKSENSNKLTGSVFVAIQLKAPVMSNNGSEYDELESTAQYTMAK